MSEQLAPRQPTRNSSAEKGVICFTVSEEPQTIFVPVVSAESVGWLGSENGNREIAAVYRLPCGIAPHSSRLTRYSPVFGFHRRCAHGAGAHSRWRQCAFLDRRWASWVKRRKNSQQAAIGSELRHASGLSVTVRSGTIMPFLPPLPRGRHRARRRSRPAKVPGALRPSRLRGVVMSSSWSGRASSTPGAVRRASIRPSASPRVPLQRPGRCGRRL